MTNETTNNIIEVGDKCTGCGACAYSCHKGCIQMTPNTEGFLYPKVNDECNGCGLCRRKCPQLQKQQASGFKQIAYIGITKDKRIYKKAASGGIFGTLAKAFLQQGDKAYVCGASYHNGKVCHLIISSSEEVQLLQNSMYVQSDLKDRYPRIKELLKQGAHVLFCGTPCQVDGLYSYLGSRPENLFTLDLICHGVPSPAFLNKDLLKYAPFGEIKRIAFRWKQPQYQKSKSAFFLSIHNKEGQEKVISSSFDPYFASFMRNESFRLSCYSCKYANLNRCGDITIGDCDSASFYPQFHPSLSRSTIIINNAQGQEIWDANKYLFDTLPLDLEREASRNHQLSHPSQKQARRDQIYHDVASMTDEQLQQKYCKCYTWKHKILFFTQRMLPGKIINILTKSIHT